MYIANIESLGGECWSSYASDISLLDNWLNIGLDNVHCQMNISTATLMSQRFLLHAMRTGEYSFAQFREDLLLRDKINL